MSSTSNTIGGRSGSVDILFSPVTTMPQKGYIYIVVPRLYTSTIVGDNSNYCVVEMITGTPNVMFASPSGSIIQPTKLSTCVLGTGSCTSTLTFASTACTLRVEYTFSRDILASDQIKIQVSSYYSPLNYQTVNGFSLLTSETVGFPATAEGKVDTLGQLGTITFTPALVPKLLNSGSVTLFNSAGGTSIKVAQKSNSISFSLNVDFPLLTSCSLLVTFPPEIKVNANEVFQTSVLDSSGFLASTTTCTPVTYSTTGATGTHNIVTVPNACAAG